ncbi:MAG: endonuclease/exonuclease/phosphatase family protein [Dehalococcoidia bacterium]
MVRILTLNLWGYNNPYDYTVRRGITRGAVAGSLAATHEAPGGSSWPLRCDRILDLLRSEQPDVAGFQEVASSPWIADGRNAAEQLASALGWNMLYADGDGPPGPGDLRNGLALLSPHPLRELARLPLPDSQGRDTHLCLCGELMLQFGRVVVLTTHFALGNDTDEESAHQDESVRRILAFGRSLPPATPVVLTGDLNAPPNSRAVRCLRGQAQIAGERGTFVNASILASGASIATMPSHDPTVPLDYVFVANAHVSGCRPVGAPNMDGYYPSDHLGLVADLQLQSEAAFVSH